MVSNEFPSTTSGFCEEHPCNKSPSAIAVTIVAAIAVAIAVPRAAAIAVGIVTLGC